MFEFPRGSVAQGRVQALSVVILLDELFDVRSQMFQMVVLDLRGTDIHIGDRLS